MQQQTLYVTQGHLFHVGEKGETMDKGSCGCALVALPVPRDVPKYSLVCYNKRRETLAVARLPMDGDNTRSLRLAAEPSGYLTFQDEASNRWSLLPAKRESVVELLAQVALAMSVLRTQAKGALTVTDFTPTVVDRPLGVQNKARVRFSSYSVQQPLTTDGQIGATSPSLSSPPASALAAVGAALESNFSDDKAPYTFQPVSSSAELGPNHRGFEGSVVGMTEGGFRGIVVPSNRRYTRTEDAHRTGADFGPTVFVVRLDRIVELAERRTEIPAVFADSDGGSSQHYGSTEAALVSYQDKRSQLVVPAGTALVRSAPDGGDGAGIPVEHMAMIQRVGAGINTATTAARDIRDISSAVAEDWEHAVRAVDKPSTLTNAALLDHIKQLVLRHEHGSADLEQREEVIRTLDERNRQLQKHVDAAALATQKLLDETKATTTAGMDIRLERSRALMKLQEQINATAQERDDAQRHLATVRRLLAASEEELQQVRSRIDVHRVQSTGMANELEVSQTALAEARGRRKGLEARLSSLTESVRSAQAQTRTKASEVESTRAAADRARDHHIQLMEDERNNRAVDAQQLRTEIVSELANKEKNFRSERARAAEDGFRRGLQEGKEQGRRDAAADVAAQQNELQLDVQRSKGQMESLREALRASIETAMASRRKLVTTVKESQAAHAEALRMKLRLQVRHERLTREATTAKDVILDRLRGVARYITQPADPEQLLVVLSTLHHHSNAGNEAEKRRSTAGQDGVPAPGPTTTDIDLTFNRLNWDAARKAAIQRRLSYIGAETLRIFEKGLTFYYAEWLQPLQRAHAECKEAVKRLWIDEHGTFHYALCTEELAARNAVEDESEQFYNELSAALSRRRAARLALWDEAAEGFGELYAAFLQGLAALRDLLAAQRKAQVELAETEVEERQRITSAAMRGLREMPSLLADAIAGELLTAQRFLAEEEEAGRAALLADELGETTVLRFNEEQHRTEARQATQRSRQRQDMRAEENTARREVEAEETAFMQQLYTQHIAVVSAIFRQTHELQRLQLQEQQRQEAMKAEERRGVVVAEEQHRYDEVESTEMRERAELAEIEVAQRPSSQPAPPAVPAAPFQAPPSLFDDNKRDPPPSLPQEEQQQQQQQQQAAEKERAMGAAVVTPSPLVQPDVDAIASDRNGPPSLPSDDEAPRRLSVGDGPPPSTKRRGRASGEAPSPFALAWAQTDNRKTSPAPARTKAEALPPARKPSPGRRFADSEEDSSSSSSSADESAPAAGTSAPQREEDDDERQPPPAAPAKKKAVPIKKRQLFDSSSDRD